MRLRHFALFWAVLFAVACASPSPQLTATSIPTSTGLLGSGCDLPCWAGVTPGITTAQEAEILLRELYGDENVAWETNGRVLNWMSLSEPVDASGWGYVVISDQRYVEYILVAIIEPITVQQLIEMIGEPSTIRVSFERRVGCWHTEVVYPDMNTTVLLNTPSSDGVAANQLVSSLRLSSPERMEQVIREVPDHSYETQWTGYQDYCPWVNDD